MSSRVLRLLISLWMRRDRARSVTFQTQELPVKRGSRICVSQSNALSLRVIQLCRPVRVVPVYSSLELSSGVSWVTDGLLFSVFSETQKQTQYFNTFISESRGCEAFSGEFTHLETDRSEEKPRTSRPDWTGWSSAGTDAGLPSAQIDAETVQTQTSAEPHLPPAWPDRSCSQPTRREDCCWHFRPVRNESGDTSGAS